MANKVVWYEVLGKDGAKLRGFYGELFGWSFTNEAGKDYGTTGPEATGVPGGIGSKPTGESWALFYVSVPDIVGWTLHEKRYVPAFSGGTG